MVVCSVILFACSKEEDIASSVDATEVNQLHLISADDAKDFVRMILRKAPVPVARDGGILAVISTYDDEGLPTRHVVNFTIAGRDGWMMLSGDRRVDPLLAYSLEGHLDAKSIELPGIEEQTGEYDATVEAVRASSSGEAFKSYDLVQLASVICPPEEPWECPDGYDPTDFCFKPMRSFGPLLDTRWGQDCPYNSRISVGGCEDDCGEASPPAGCVPVAIAQVANYWEEPGGFEYVRMLDRYDWWDGSDRATAERLSNVADLVSFVGNTISANYTCNYTWAVPWKIDDTFEDMGYDNDGTRTTWTMTQVSSEIQAGRPVIVEGRRTLISDWHVWVVDGYRHMVDGKCNPHTWQHMNWGWNGRGNGWYKSGIWQAVDDGENAGSDYSRYNKIVKGIRP